MSTKTSASTTETASPNGANHPQRTIDQGADATVRTGTEDKLWKALRAHPNHTTTQLSVIAGIGKSTAGKILARWANEGSATRTSGTAEGNRRAADLWSITEANDVSADQLAPAVEQQPLASTPEQNDEGLGNDTADEVEDVAVTDAADSSDTDMKSEPDDSAGEAPSKQLRLPPGGLRGLVEDWLRDHPTEEFSPNKIGKELTRSAGAVHNALEKLVHDGYAVRTSDRPKRYTLAPTGTS
ncbi:MarR family transcriptional regulator [Kibdelosporangium philippinense]|uniref:MarR family transcriptional regulator n=1 Tax=Kibdelosporangium philippinense TaxID=211113 RepID=A0ABS8ZQP8_9PSEU|nr:MarR family transcriptional regulator [Kibdelosporangium philippinense]MCE7009922.1 MarR family transcriptional regulator [Kibdelosporangium philippinense]